MTAFEKKAEEVYDTMIRKGSIISRLTKEAALAEIYVELARREPALYEQHRSEMHRRGGVR